MSLSKFVIKLLGFLIEILVESCEYYEKETDCDADGIPFSEEYERQSFLLAAIRDCIKCVESANNQTYEKENVENRS